MSPFKFKQFTIHQDKSLFKINVDGVLLAAWANVKGKKHGLDIGTGTGVIALASCQRNNSIIFDAVENDLDSANQAKENFRQSKFSERLEVFHEDVQTFTLSAKKKYDYIISNPPYFHHQKGTPTKSKLQNAKHTNLLSFEDLISSTVRVMSEDASFHVVLPYQEGKEMINLAKQYHLFVTRQTVVRGRKEKPIERLLLSFSREEKEVIEDSLVIQKSGVRHDYTSAYINLLKDFYTIM